MDKPWHPEIDRVAFLCQTEEEANVRITQLRENHDNWTRLVTFFIETPEGHPNGWRVQGERPWVD